MPSRTRPTARLLTPAGWIGLLLIAALAAAGALALLGQLPRA